MGNAFYGGSVMNKDKHCQTVFHLDNCDISHVVNKPHFMGCTLLRESAIDDSYGTWELQSLP